MNADGSDLRQLTSDNTNKSRPAWAPDGSKIAYSAYTGDTVKDWDIYIVNPDGSNPDDITKSPRLDDFPSWSPKKK